MTRFNKLRAFVAVAALSAASGAFAADIDMNADANDVAISGYDPVAYFPEGGGKPTKGKRTRSNKSTDKYILRSRHAKKGR